VILIGDKNVPFETFSKITVISDIEKTKPNSVVLFDFDIGFLQYTLKNDIPSAVIVKDILQSIYCHNLGAKYIISSKELAFQIQDLADNYLYDSKILAIIENENEIEELAKKHIDGVIYSRVLG